MTLDGLSLLLNPLIQTHILVLKQRDLPFQLLHILQLRCKLFTAELVQAVHIGLHRDEALIILIEVLFSLLEALHFLLIILSYLRQVLLPCLIRQISTQHNSRGVNVVCDGLLRHLA